MEHTEQSAAILFAAAFQGLVLAAGKNGAVQTFARQVWIVRTLTHKALCVRVYTHRHTYIFTTNIKRINTSKTSLNGTFLVAYEPLFRYALENECRCCPRHVFCTGGVGWLGRGEEKESWYRFFLDLSKKGLTTKWLNMIIV